MSNAVSRGLSASWLTKEGALQLEQLFRSVVYLASVPIVIADEERICWDASCGARKLLGVTRERIVGHPLDEFVTPEFRPEMAKLWPNLLVGSEPFRALRLHPPEGGMSIGHSHEVECLAKSNVLPGRHAIVFREKFPREEARGGAAKETAGNLSGWAHDYAVYLFDRAGTVVAWYGGAERTYGYTEAEMLGRSIMSLRADSNSERVLQEEQNRAAAQGHYAWEEQQARKDQRKFSAHVLTLALRRENGQVEGYARVVRHYTARSALLRSWPTGGVLDPLPKRTTAGVVSGEFDRVVEANDAFLNAVGYTREEVAAGKVYWPDLTPPEFAEIEEAAHEEALRFGACAPYPRTCVHKDGRKASVLVTFAVLNLFPFHWMAIVHAVPPEHVDESVPEAAKEEKFDEIVGRSPETKRVLKLVETVAPTDATVLILGETGTGKELVARAIHRLSRRKNFPFVTLNCAAIPTGLLESELFGYERGAFTGALTQKIGRFEMANRGTLFLDEVGDIPLALQPKLLRALQERSFERLGSTKTTPIDVRLIAATNRDLAQMMAENQFRGDLYYRLKVFPIQTPRLRDRPEDVPALVHFFTRKYAEELGKHVSSIPAETMRALVHWPWPGNVRELENFVERSVILSSGTTLQAPLSELRVDAGRPTGTLQEMEHDYILRVLKESNGVVSRAAARLGVPRTTLNAMMVKLGISRKDI